MFPMAPDRRMSWLAACLLMLALSTGASSRATESDGQLLQQSWQRYEAGKLEEAKILLQTVRQQAESKGDGLNLAIALSNLALIESQQGNWVVANQTIGESLQALQKVANSPAKTSILAQVLNVQGRLQLIQGEADSALKSWQRSAVLYRQVGNTTGEIQSQLRQVSAFQALGLYARSYQDVLLPLEERLRQQPDSSTKAWGLRSLGEGMGVVGNLSKAEQTLRQSLEVAQRLGNRPEISASQLTLANLLAIRIRELARNRTLKRWEQEQLDRDTAQAIDFYQQVAAAKSVNQLRAKLNLLALLLDRDRTNEAVQLVAALQVEITPLAPDRAGIEARLNFAHSLGRLQMATGNGNGANIALLRQTLTQARSLKDNRLLATTLGNLGQALEQTQQLRAAQTVTEEAVLLAKSINALDQVYRWSAQLGRLQEHQGNPQGAIAAYTQAVNTLRILRSDLLGIDADSLVVEPEALEPVHRQLVSLLLPKDGSQPSKQVLGQARNVIESLQLEEINNYLRAACLQALVDIDKVPVPQQTAMVYPIILPDRIATIVSITGQEPKLYTQLIPQAEVESTVKTLQSGLRNRISLEFQQPSRQLYDWLIKPIAAELHQQKVETLVFVLDGVFRNIPMAALSDGQQFLIEQYSIATTPGLKLTKPQPLQAQALSGIAFGLTESRTVELPGGRSQNFSDLPYVEPELQDLQQEIRPSTVALNRQFTRNQFEQSLQKSQAPIVHLATHGQFSSNRDQTFLLASDGVIDIDQLAIALGAGSDNRTTPIELLVLSACETAIGDDRAPLGLAGIALKSGARSTIASLWKVNDNATSVLMQQFYKELATRQVTKAVALQRAQRAILNDPQFRRHPYFWAPFILVGNWL